MVARGDMGVEIPPEEVPLAQKMIIEKCNDHGKPVITATQMLDSMIRNPRATRAEITDVANAILDGTDAVMLSGETAVGKYPVKAVSLMSRIAIRIEESMDYQARLELRRRNQRQNIADAISLATCQTAHDLGARAIICSTQSGATARSIAKYRPEALIIAVCPNQSIVNRLMLTWGVNPIAAKKPGSLEELIDPRYLLLSSGYGQGWGYCSNQRRSENRHSRQHQSAPSTKSVPTTSCCRAPFHR